MPEKKDKRPYYAAAALLFLAAAAVAPLDDLPAICLSKRWLNLSCPACGLTHSIGAIARLQFVRAWQFNPFGFIFAAIAVFFALAPLLKTRPYQAGISLLSRGLPLIVLGMFLAWLPAFFDFFH